LAKKGFGTTNFYLRPRAIAIFSVLALPLFISGRNEKKKRDSFLIKNRENLTKFYKKEFCFFQKFKFILFTKALEIFYTFFAINSALEIFLTFCQ
jgi:hypothetical protein